MAIYGQMSCDMPMELLKKGVGWQDRAVYSEAILFCRKELTDGIIDRVLLPMWMIDMPVDERAERLDRMVSLRALRKHKRGWRFPPHVWAEWGVMRADVEAKRAAEAQRKADYRKKMSQRDNDGTSAGRPLGQNAESQTVRDRDKDRDKANNSPSYQEHQCAVDNSGIESIEAWANRRRA